MDQIPKNGSKKSKTPKIPKIPKLNQKMDDNGDFQTLWWKSVKRKQVASELSALIVTAILIFLSEKRQENVCNVFSPSFRCIALQSARVKTVCLNIFATFFRSNFKNFIPLLPFLVNYISKDTVDYTWDTADAGYTYYRDVTLLI